MTTFPCQVYGCPRRATSGHLCNYHLIGAADVSDWWKAEREDPFTPEPVADLLDDDWRAEVASSSRMPANVQVRPDNRGLAFKYMASRRSSAKPPIAIEMDYSQKQEQFDDLTPWSEVSEEFGFTRQAAQQLANTAMRKLRRAVASRLGKDLLER